VIHPLLTSLLMSSVILFGVGLLMFLMYYIRRRCHLRKMQPPTNDVSHIDKYMPPKKFKDLSDVEGVNCSVCLNDIARE
jgi:hypothetical protein